MRMIAPGLGPAVVGVWYPVNTYHRLGQVCHDDAVGAGQVGDGAGHLHHPVQAAA